MADNKERLSATEVATGTLTMFELKALQDHLYWLENRPSGGGNNVLVTLSKRNKVIELTGPPYNVKSRVNEYGGGAFTPSSHGVFFVNSVDQGIYLVEDDGISMVLKGNRDICYGDLHWDTNHQRILAVQEQYLTPSRCTQSIIAIDFQTRTKTLIHEGHDFYASPKISASGNSLAFIHWNQPNMPWDTSALTLLSLDTEGYPKKQEAVCFSNNQSILNPSWNGNDLLFLSDKNGYWNLFRYDGHNTACIFHDSNDYCDPPWVLGNNSYISLTSREIVAARSGVAPGLEMIDAEKMRSDKLKTDSSAVTFNWMTRFRDGFCCVVEYSDKLPELVYFSKSQKPGKVLRSSGNLELPQDKLIHPTHQRFPTSDGKYAHAYLYEPKKSQLRNKAGLLPLLIMVHGGPTGSANSSLNTKAQYYATRGWMVADINYRGSSGYGRRYRQSLLGKWGALDVSDCEDLAKYLIENKTIDPKKLAIRGSSAGGFTVLSAIANSHIFKAAVCYYGISDLKKLAKETHRFESCYIGNLVGGTENLSEKSPIRSTNRITCPTIFFQGSKDPIVQPEQTRTMYQALKQAKVKTEYLEFEEESHGFRLEKNIVCAIESEYAFLCESLLLADQEMVSKEFLGVD